MLKFFYSLYFAAITTTTTKTTTIGNAYCRHFAIVFATDEYQQPIYKTVKTAATHLRNTTRVRQNYSRLHKIHAVKKLSE